MRDAYKNRVRLTPGGTVFQGKWYPVPDDAPRYPDWTRLVPYSQVLQFKNPESIPTNLGEVTPDSEKHYGYFQNEPNRCRTPFSRPYASRVTVTTPADGPHGTPAAYRMEPEENGEYSAKVWEPGTITPEEFAALPQCIQDRFPAPFACDPWLWEEDDPMYWEDDDEILIQECDGCDAWLWDEGDPMYWESEDEIYIEACDCEPWLWEGDDPMFWEGSDVIEIECPG